MITEMTLQKHETNIPKDTDKTLQKLLSNPITSNTAYEMQQFTLRELLYTEENNKKNIHSHALDLLETIISKKQEQLLIDLKKRNQEFRKLITFTRELKLIQPQEQHKK